LLGIVPGWRRVADGAVRGTVVVAKPQPPPPPPPPIKIVLSDVLISSYQ
jgi:hypothetical protein